MTSAQTNAGGFTRLWPTLFLERRLPGEAAAEAGFRLTCGKAMMDVTRGVPAGLRETTKQSLAECDARLLSESASGQTAITVPAAVF